MFTLPVGGSHLRVGHRLLRRFTVKFRQIPKALSAAIAFAAALTGLIFGLWPTARPEAPATTKGAALLSVSVDRVSLGQYLDRMTQSRTGYSREDLHRQGVLVRYDVKIKGYRGKHLLLTFQLIDAQSRDLVAPSRNQCLTPDVSDDKGGVPIWIPVPRGRERRFVIELELFNDRRTTSLAHDRSPQFNGS